MGRYVKNPEATQGQTLEIPSVTTANRPSGKNGQIIFNTTTSTYQVYNGAQWYNVSEASREKTLTVDTFQGDGSTTVFDISQECPSANDLMVFVDNVRQEPGSGKSYTLAADGSGLLKRVTFDAAPDADAEIYVINPHLSPEIVASAQNLENRAFSNQTELAEVGAQGQNLVDVGNQIALFSTRVSYLLEQARSAKKLRGAVDEDHRNLSSFQDALKRRNVDVIRTLEDLNDADCRADSGSSNIIERDLFSGDNIITDKIGFEICIIGNSATYKVIAKEVSSTQPLTYSGCEISLIRNSLPKKTDC